MNDRSTRPTTIEGTDDSFPRAWQKHGTIWSFGSAQRRVFGWTGGPLKDVNLPSSKNLNGTATTGPQEIKSPERKPTSVPGRVFGRRGLAALSHWEGVVEDIKGEVFRCCLVPLTLSAADDGEFEFTDFSFQDLANEDDRDLVKPGAVFYWTVGRARNSAGTVTNVSLVRLRRLPALTQFQHKQAEREAEDLLRLLGPEDGSDFPSS